MRKILLGSISLLAITVCLYSNANAQLFEKDTANYPYWVDMMEDPNANYFETIKAFETYWKDREITKGSGHKPFMRWAFDAQSRILPDGTLEPLVNNFLAFEEWKKEKAKLDVFIPPGTPGSAGPCPKDGSWEELGPILYPKNNVSQPTGMGRVNAIAFHPTDSNIIYAGAPAGGLWKTTDGGLNWLGLTDDMATLGVSAIHINPNTPNTIYIGTGDRDASNSTGLGVYKSTNGGASFSKTNTGMGNQTVCKMIVDPNNQNKIVAATKGGIYRTINGGTNWSKVNSSTNFREIDFKPSDFKTQYASSGGKFYLSSDSGKSFSQITSGLPSSKINRGVIGVSKDNPSVVYFVVTEQRVFIGLYKSTNSGMTFSSQSTTPNIMDYSSDGSGTGGQAFYDLDIAVNPKDIDEIYVGGVNVFKSTNGGVNWAIDAHWTGQGGKGKIHADNHIMKFDPLNNNLFVGNDGGFYKRNDWDGEWHEFSNALAIGQVYRVSAAQTKQNFIVNGYQDNGMSFYEGKGSFVTFRGGDGVDNAVDPTNADYYYGSYIYGVITRHGFGSDGDIAKNGLNGVDEEGAWVSPYVLREGVPGTMISGYKNIWISTNIKTADKDDISWKKISSGLASVDNKNMHKVENSPADNKILYASRSDNKLFRTDDLTAGTVTWTDLTSKLPSTGIVEDIECDYKDPKVVYIIQNKKVYKSTDKGLSWNNLSTGLPNIALNDLILDSSKTDGSMYVAAYAGVYYKNDNSSTWKSYFNNLPANVPVRDLEITYNTDPSEYRLIAGTYGRGTWQTQLYDNGVNKPIAEIDMGKSAICKGETAIFYNTSDYYGEKVCWVITPSTGVSFTNGTSASSKDKANLLFANAGSYEVKLVVENCNGKDSVTETINVYTTPKTATCNSTTTNLSNGFGMGIWEFKLGAFTNPSKGAVASGSNEDFTCFKINELKASTKYDVNVKTGSANNESVSIYIDYDNNGSFASSERVFTNTNAKTHSGNFTTPSNAVTGKALRLRVISKFGTSLPTGPCQTFTHGQSEDYSIVILGDKADFTATKTSACKTETIKFTDASTANGSYAWTFGSGATPATANTIGPHNVTYSTIGKKTVKLIMNGTITEEKVNFITINETPAVSIAITKGGATNCEKSEVVLTATDSKSAAQSYEWYKGATKLSETSNTLTIASFSSNDVGSYYAKGINGPCSSNSGAKALSIAGLINADFTINLDRQCIKTNSFVLTNTSTSSGSPLTSKWNFSNNTNSSLQSPTINFLSAGNYTAKLVITSNEGCNDSTTKSLIVDPAVNSNFTFTNPDKNQFNFNSDVSTYSNYKWDFDNGNGSASTANSSYDFVNMGDYDVILIVQNETCKDTTTKKVTAQFNSINKIAGFDNLKVSPNPSDGFIKISFELKEAKDLSFDIFDINGKHIAQLDEPTIYNGVNNQIYDLRKIGLANGTYFIHIVSQKGTNTIKIIIK